jgi:putative nucleotidyltransferase with HDIG domain
LVILVLMLKKMGLDEDCLDITGTDKETIARIIIPLSEARAENLSILSETVVNNVNSLPQFPENIMQVQKMINDPNSDMQDIGSQISRDPALTADLLKTVNSAAYMLVRKVDNIGEAVRMVGMRGIKNLLYSYGTQKILGDDSEEKKGLWEHSYKTAFYAFNLVRNFKRDHNLLDDAYVGGILHDMGKIVFSNVHPELLEKIQNFCREKGLPASTFEDLAAGMNHAEIGSLIAKKWNFPDNLVATIRYHHDPQSAPEEYRSLVYTVYLANMLCEIEAGNYEEDQIEPEALDFYGFTNKKQIDAIMQQFREGFEKENTRK